MEPELPTDSARIEVYLDQILAPLTHRLSAFHRDELRRELREHLWARIDAYHELGHLDEDAVTEALKQFGGAEDFVQQWRREWLKMPSTLTLRDVYEAGKKALRPTLLSLAGAMVPYGLLAATFHWTYAGSVLTELTALLTRISQIRITKLNTDWFWLLTEVTFLILPVLIVIRQGKSNPERAGIGILAALTAEFIVAALLYQAIDCVWPNSTIASEIFTPLLCLLAVWLPLASGTAAISGWWARRSQTTLRQTTLYEDWQVVRSALRPSLLGVVAAALSYTIIHLCYTNLQGSFARTFLYRNSGTVLVGWECFAFLLLPLLVGIKQGQHTPVRAGMGILMALIAEFVTVSLLYETATWILPQGFWGSSVGTFVKTDSSMLFAVMAAWLHVATGAAAISGWWTGRSKSHRLGQEIESGRLHGA